MRGTLTLAVVLVTATIIYALLPGGTIAFLGFEVLILIVAWLAVRRIAPVTEAAPDDEAVGFIPWRWWRRSRRVTAAPAPPQLRKVENLLRFSRKHAFTAEERLVPLLRELAAERLAAGYGIDMEEDPETARTMLGAQGWEILGPEWSTGSDGSRSGPTQESLEAAVSAIEDL